MPGSFSSIDLYDPSDHLAEYWFEYFLIDDGEKVVPVEVKAEINLKAKSLRTYHDKYDPEFSVRTSMADYKEEEWLINLPLYAVAEIS